MKTTAFKFNVILIALLAVSSLFTSCKKDDVKPEGEGGIESPENLRSLAMGTYDYTLEFYVPNGSGGLNYLGSEYDEQGVVEVKEEAGTNSSFTIQENGEELFRGTGISPTSVGFSFYIPGQQIDDDETQIDIKGYENWEMDGQMHEGLFRSDSNELRAAFEATVDNVSVIMVFRGYQQ